jgi:hypothetical protein
MEVDMPNTQTAPETVPADKTPDKSPSVKPGQYSIARAEGKCHICGRPIASGEKLLAALRETPVAMERLDICSNCRSNFETTGLLGFWQTTMQPLSAKKKLFVDDDVLCDLFARLVDTQEPAKLNFRFVLGLILMRKRRLVYESTRHEAETEIWTVRFKGKEETMDLVNPRLGEQQVAEVSAQLGEILSTDL